MTLHLMYKNGQGIARLAKRMDFHANCKGRIRKDYINKSIDKAHYIAAAFDENTAALTGFACLLVKRDSVYVSALCSHGQQGRACMQQVYLLAKMLGKKEVTLESIHSAKPFYLHIGFHQQGPTSKSGLSKMVRAV